MTSPIHSDASVNNGSTSEDGDASSLNSSWAQQKEYLPAIATMSLGKAGVHSLDAKLEAAASMGFQGIELFWDDLQAYTATLDRNALASTAVVPLPDVVTAARIIGQLCARLNLTVISLQPFRNFDGLVDTKIRRERINEFKMWLMVAQELGAGTIGVPSTIDSQPGTHTGDLDTIAAGLDELATLATPYKIKIAYENLCFGKHVRSWDQAWKAVRKTSCPGGIDFLPDTFNLCGDVFADPSVTGGQACKSDPHKDLMKSIKQLTTTVPMCNMSLLQVADAELMDPPLTLHHPWMAAAPEGTDAKKIWSRNARLFPMEEGGYLPIVGVVEVLVKAGWSGWVSLEVFSRTTEEPGDGVIWEHARRGWGSWEKLATIMGWDVRPGQGREFRKFSTDDKDAKNSPWHSLK